MQLISISDVVVVLEHVVQLLKPEFCPFFSSEVSIPFICISPLLIAGSKMFSSLCLLQGQFSAIFDVTKVV